MNLRLLPLVLLVGLVACASPARQDAPTEAASQPQASTEATSVSVADFLIDPSTIELAGPTVTLEVTNDGPTPHNLTVRDGNDAIIMATPDLAVGQTDTISAELEPGEYTIFCSLAGHESLGMSGTLTVEGS